MNDDDRTALLSAPYRLGGRDTSGLDCLGVVLLVLQIRGVPEFDPWDGIIGSWRNGEVDCASGFPEGWKRAEGAPIDGDVLIFFTDHSWSAIVHEGNLWTAHPSVGVWCKPVGRFKKAPREVWRFKQ
jgi:cell wall-associated NlpC family hydrolase